MLPTFNLKGKIALVTGGSRGIGKAIAKDLLRSNANVIITGRNKDTIMDSANELASLSKGKVIPYICDVTDSLQINELKEYIINRFGKLDILVNNAGIVMDKYFLKTTDHDIEEMVNINLIGVMKTTRLLGEIMTQQKSGKIINIGSYDGLVGTPQLVAYGTTKGGVIQFTRMLAVEWARYNINVNVICPGYIRTSMNEHIFENEVLAKKIINRIPLRRVAKPEEISPLVVYLSSNSSDYMTGQVLTIDGGETAQ